MKQLTNIKKIFFFFLIVIILSQSVFAWGILPSKQLAPFTQSTQQLSMTVRNTDFSEGYFVVEFSGDLAPHATFSRGTIYIPAEKSFNLTVRFLEFKVLLNSLLPFKSNISI